MNFQYNGKTWDYDENTMFILEIGRYLNQYKIEKTFHYENYQVCTIENLPKEAISAYENYQVSNGYKKRLSMKQIPLENRLNEPRPITIAKYLSSRDDETQG